MPLDSLHVDPLVCVEQHRPIIREVLEEELKTRHVKWHLVMEIGVYKLLDGMDFKIMKTKFRSAAQLLELEDAIDEQVTTASEHLNKILDGFVQMGSGWMVQEIITMSIVCAAYMPIVGCRYLSLPKWIADKRSCC